jgi:hypothetical protein
MPRSLPRLSLIALSLLAPATLAFAQQTTQQPAPSQAPPKLERIEPGSDVPATTIPPRERTQIKEKKQGGQVTEVEVQSGPSHYYMKPNTPAGNAQAGTAEAGSIRAPQWQVLEFDIGGKKKKGSAESGEAAAEAPAAAEVPPPPRPEKK